MFDLLAKALRDSRWAAVGWSVGLLALALLHMAVFPSIEGDESLQQFYDQLPDAFRNAFGGGRAFNTLEGYLEVEFASYAPVMMAIYALTHANRALAGEEQEGHFDFLLAQPLQRWQVVASHAGAQALGVLAIALATGFGLIAGAFAFGIEANEGILLLAALNGVPLALAVGGITLAASAIGHRRSVPVAVGTAFLLVSFFLNALAPLADATRPLQKGSLFYHYQQSDALGGTMDPLYVAVGLVVWLAGAVLAAVWFERKDIHA
ncbi:MAG: ABC transporter permease subunit [Candidatus Thermoplasmatota archaeon]|jgi:ABC-2 type transport system permease protein